MGKMRLLLAVLILAAGGGGYVLSTQRSGLLQQAGSWLEDGQAVEGEPATPEVPLDPPPLADPMVETIRVATFKLGRLDRRKLAERQTREVLARLIPQYDLVALQDIRAQNRGILMELTTLVNATGVQYAFATCPSVGRDATEQFSVFLYNRATIETDPLLVYSLHDPQRHFERPPLIGAFRVRGPDPGEAFTFTLVNIQIDPAHGADERSLLADVYRAVRDDGRNEDDILLLGNLDLQEEYAESLDHSVGLVPTIVGTPTLARGGAVADNILLNARATREFTGRSQVVDLMREFELTIQQTLTISDHLPVWAEFAAREGAQPIR